MLTKRIIPCLDVKDGRTVKGVCFEELRDAGDPVAFAATYADNGADELVLLDITATADGRKTWVKIVEEVARAIHIPFTVGGGIDSIDDVYRLLRAGADKVSLNSAAVRRPELIKELSAYFGNQCIVLAIDAKQIGEEWKVFISGGKIATDYNLLEWAEQGVAYGAGEILFTSMTHDGSKSGYANEALYALSQKVNVPVVASGGAGTMQDFKDAFVYGHADAALAASVFHYGSINIKELKQYLAQEHIPVRL